MLMWRLGALLMLMCAPLLAGEVPVQPESSAPDLASLERQIWQAYYDKNLQKTSSLANAYLVKFFSLNEDQAKEVAPLFLKSMETYSGLPINTSDTDYNTKVLPDLEALYKKVASFVPYKLDAMAAAQNELAWWVARRRVPSRNIGNVANLMAQALSTMLGKPSSYYQRMAYLRASAARYRDRCQNDWGGVCSEDWQMVENLLRLAYSQCPPQTELNKTPCDPTADNEIN